MSAFTSQERRTAIALSLVYTTRMMGLFLLLPVMSILGQDLDGATPLLLGLAVGIYGLCQALLQIPFGLLSDRFGRKPVILAGIAIFIVGSLIAATADSIVGIIVGRAIQGAAAISAVVMALAADLTRDSQRTKIMAVIGVSIGMSFIVSIIVGPLLMTRFSLAGIFYCIAGLGVFSAALILFAVPTPIRTQQDRNIAVVLRELPALFANRDLLRLDIGILLLHLLITASFICIPLRLLELGVFTDVHWSVYLKAACGSLLILIPLVGLAERKLTVKSVMMVSIAGLAVAEFALGLMNNQYWVIVASIVLFFGFLSVLEALLPSLVSRTAPAAARGSAMGIYSTSQFLGAFLGGVLGGWMIGEFALSTSLFVLGLLCLLWFPVIWRMQEPIKLKNQRMMLNADVAQEIMSSEGSARVTQQLLSVSGVKEVSLISSDGCAYLKVDKQELDEQELSAFSVQLDDASVAGH